MNYFTAVMLAGNAGFVGVWYARPHNDKWQHMIGTLNLVCTVLLIAAVGALK